MKGALSEIIDPGYLICFACHERVLSNGIFDKRHRCAILSSIVAPVHIGLHCMYYGSLHTALVSGQLRCRFLEFVLKHPLIFVQ